jgi:hypothetical protein
VNADAQLHLLEARGDTAQAPVPFRDIIDSPSAVRNQASDALLRFLTAIKCDNMQPRGFGSNRDPPANAQRLPALRTSMNKNQADSQAFSPS